jgi:uncharacterized protein YjdB
MKKTNKILTILGCAALGLAGIGVASTLSSKAVQTKATSNTLVINASSFSAAWSGKTSTSYATYDWSSSGSDSASYSGKASTVAYDGATKATRTFIQLNSSKYPYLYNITAVSYITNITIVTDAAQPSARTVTPYVSTSAAMVNSSTTVDGTALAGKTATASASATLSWDVSLDSGYKFFNIAVSGATYIDSITVTFAPMPTYDPVESFGMTPATSNMTTGDTLQLASTVLPSTAKQGIVYSSSDTSVVGVDNTGLITAYAPGTATITGTTAGTTSSSATISKTCVVTVTDNTITTTEANTIVTALADNTYSDKIYKISGTISSATTANRSYVVTDGTTPITFFGSYDQFATNDFIVGGTVTMRGYLQKYVKSGTTTIELTYQGSVSLTLVSYSDSVTEFVSWIATIGSGDSQGMTNATTCLSNYQAGKTKVKAMDTNALTKLQTSTLTDVVAAKTRYLNWCNAVGDATPYEGTIISSANPISITSENDYSSVYYITGVSIFAIAVGAFFYFRKKKQA